MPANLTPDYLEAEREYRRAETPAARIAALERMLATLPKHKGTEKLLADIRRKLSQARKESGKKSAAHSAPFYLVRKEGAGQVALVGPPNAGKSQLVSALTHARPEVAPFPFTTHAPVPGMMSFEDVQIQLVDLPPISRHFTEPWLPQALRTADLRVLVADLGDGDVLDGIEYILETLAGWRIPPPALLAANKRDLPGAEAAYQALAELYAPRLPCLAISAAAGENLDAFRRAVFEALRVVRVYTKAPGKKADLGAPYVLPRGSTVLDAARHVHKDFAEHLRYARLFHAAGGKDGLMVERAHQVEDGDILEFHI